MPRIVRIINRLNLGGPTYNAVYLTKYLAPEFETILIAGVKQATEESSEFILRELGVEPVIIPEMSRDISPFKDIISYNKINSIIKTFKPHIVHTHAAKAGALGRVAAIRNKVPVLVHTFHGHFFHSYFSSYKTKIFLKKTTSPVKAFIIGDGEDRYKIESVASSLRIPFSTPEKNNPDAKLVFTSWIKKIDTAIAGLDIIAMTSLNEGTPVSIIEAQAAGKPVIATSVGGIDDVVIKGETALLSATGNSQAFAQNMLLLIQDEALRKKMQAKGKEFVSERFSYKRLVRDMSLLYNELLSKKTIQV